MKKIGYICLTALLALCSCTKKEKLLIGGIGYPQIAIVDKASGIIEWTHPLEAGEECNDVEMTPDGYILYAGKRSAKLIDRNHQLVWTFDAKDSEALYTATRLASGNFMVAIAGYPARIVELDKKGMQIKELTFHAPAPDITLQFRQILKTPQNTYLIPLTEKHRVIELTEEGKRINNVFCGGMPVSVKLIPGGRWLVSGGKGRAFMEIDPETKEVVKTVETENMSFGKLLYAGELIRYKNGNTLVANWNGESDDKLQPALFEVDSLNHVVWRLSVRPEIGAISAVYSFFE